MAKCLYCNGVGEVCTLCSNDPENCICDDGMEMSVICPKCNAEETR
jgi:hypothetical protein